MKRDLFINYFVLLFVWICVSIVFLIGLYYFTPNNFIIKDYDNTLYSLIQQKQYIVSPNDYFILSDNDYYLQIILSSNELNIIGQESNLVINKDINLIIRNWLKSQNIIYESDELIKLNNTSELVYFNNSNEPIAIKVYFYQKY